MDEFTSVLFERAYQSYLTGGDIYCIKLQKLNPRTLEKYEKSLKYLEDKDLITVLNKSDTKIRLVITEEGINFGNSMI